MNLHTQPTSRRGSRCLRAFTLIELLVCMGIIAALITILIPTISGAKKSASDTKCRSNLRQLYVAQVLYAQQNRDRMTPVIYKGQPSPFANNESSWQAALQATMRTQSNEILQCPDAVDVEEGTFSYGINSCIMMPQWSRRFDKRPANGLDAARTSPNSQQDRYPVSPSDVILIADKGSYNDDYLRTDESSVTGALGGFNWIPPQSGTPLWEFWAKHKNTEAYRHGNKASVGLNAVFLDGSVRRLLPNELSLRGGRWFWGVGPEYNQVQGATCCQ